MLDTCGYLNSNRKRGQIRPILTEDNRVHKEDGEQCETPELPPRPFARGSIHVAVTPMLRCRSTQSVHPQQACDSHVETVADVKRQKEEEDDADGNANRQGHHSNVLGVIREWRGAAEALPWDKIQLKETERVDE